MFNNNPTLNEKVLESVQVLEGKPMTIGGTMNKTIFLSLIMLVPAFVCWYQLSLGYTDKVNIMMTIGAIVGFICAMVIIFKKQTAAYLAPVYAFSEGAFLGGLSAIVEAMYPGIAIQAICATMLTAFSMAFLYRARIIKVTEKFRSVILGIMFTIFILYLVSFVLSFFGKNIPYLFDSSPIGIGFSVFVVIVAALNLLFDFDFIEKGSNMMLPKYMEWYGAFGILVTLVWLYVEILRLLTKLRDQK